jgi:hypothetical protein
MACSCTAVLKARAMSIHLLLAVIGVVRWPAVLICLLQVPL